MAKSKTRQDGATENLKEIAASGGFSFAKLEGVVQEEPSNINRYSLLGKCVHFPVDAALAGDIKIIGDDDALDNEFSKHQVVEKVGRAVKSAILRGRSYLVIDVAKDGAEKTSEELSLEKLMEVEEIVFVTRKQGEVLDNGTLRVTKGSITKTYNKTRYFVIDTEDEGNAYNLSGNLTHLSAAINQYNSALGHANAMLRRKQQPVYKMKGLDENVKNNPEAKKHIQTKLDVVKDNMGEFNVVGIGDEDSFDVIDVSLGNVGDVITENKLKISALSYVPVTHLFGESSKGLNSTGDGDNTVFLTYIETIRAHYCEPVIKWLAKILGSQKTIKAKLQKFDIELLKIDWKPVVEPTEKEKSEVEEAKARAKKLNIDMLISLIQWDVYQAEEVKQKLEEAGVIDGVIEALGVINGRA